MPSEPRSREELTTWSQTEVEQLLGWMEDNPDQLHGKQIDWYQEVKDQVFGDDDHITPKRIKAKAMNMKNSWEHAKAMQDRCGWGLKAEDCSQSIQDVLEKRCMCFWRLDEIWGSLSYGSGDEEPAESVRTGAGNINARDEVDLDSDETTTPSRRLLRSESESTGRQSIASSERESSTMSSVYGLPRREGRDRIGPIKRILDDCHEQIAEFENKRLRMEKELQREKIQAEDRRFNRQMEAQERIAKMQAETALQVARIQAEAQTRQLQVIANIFSAMCNAQGGQRMRNIHEREDTNDQEDKHDGADSNIHDE